MYNLLLYNQKYHVKDLGDYSFLVTGGAGFIGSNIVEYLLRNGAGKVRVLDNLSNGIYTNISKFLTLPNFEFIEGDICDYDTCKKAVNGINFISHQAALGSVPRSINDPIKTNEVNISGFLNMLDCAKNESSVLRFIYAASSSTYGDSPHLPKQEDTIGNPLSPYAVTKLVNELYASVYSKVYNFHTIGLRYFNVFGPNQSPDNAYAAVIPLFIKSAIEKRSPTIFGDGSTSRDFTFIENVVQANIKALFCLVENHNVVNIACGNSTTLLKLWAIISEKFGCPEIKPIHKDDRIGDIKHSNASIIKAGNLFEYVPKIQIDEGIETLYKLYIQSVKF